MRWISVYWRYNGSDHCMGVLELPTEAGRELEDYESDPADLLELQQVQSICRALARGRQWGQVGDYVWRETAYN